MPFVPSSIHLFLVVMPGATSSVLAPSSTLFEILGLTKAFNVLFMKYLFCIGLCLAKPS